MSECPIPCNLCGGTDVEVIGVRDRDGRPLRTTVCTQCGLVWSNPRPGPEQVRQYYSKEYRLHYKGRATPSLRHVARSGRGALNRYRELAAHVQPGAAVLDAGAGGGEVVYVLRHFGYDARGLEPDEQYADYARSVLGLPVETGFVQDASFPSSSFDAVTLYHALEHVEDPVAILHRLRSWLKPGGMLLVEVPNIEAVCVSPAHRFHFAHFYNFNRGTLERAGNRAGLTPVSTTASPDGGNITTIFRVATAQSASQDEDGRENARRVMEIVRSHTPARYYSSRWPYLGPLARLRTYLADRAAARGCATPRQVLDRLIERSGHPG